MENLHYSVKPEGIAEIIFDMADSRANLLTREVMEELDGCVLKASKDPSIRALVVRSAKPGIFIAGADIHEIEGINTPEEAASKSLQGQEILNRLESLPFPTVCVINGACVGGGLELAMACGFRVVTDNLKTSLGLPETSLGIIPGFGGTKRLPRLIGLAESLKMILSGRPVEAKKAFKIKLADALYSEAFLEEGLAGFIKKVLSPRKRREIEARRRRRRLSEALLENNPLGRALLFRSARKDLLKKTRGFYPAPLTALNVIRKGYPAGLKKALSIERQGFSKMAVDPVCKNLIHVYFTGEELKKASHPPKDARIQAVHQAGVLGAGKMGGGIAWLFSSGDIPVRMKDISWEALSAGYKAIQDIYSGLRKIHKIDERNAGLKFHKVTASLDYSGFSNADVVIEAIIEDRDVKIKTLQELEKAVRDDTIIATNTSSLSVDELAGGLRHPERFVGFHFFNPVNRMPLIEVVKGSKTSETALQTMVQLAIQLKKTPIIVQDCHGFLVNRILMAYLNEAVLMLEEGASFEAIDRIVYDFGMPMGPFTLLDEIGIQVGAKIARILTASYPDRSTPGKLFPLIAEKKGLTGKSSGRGFFLYQKGVKKPNPEIAALLSEAGIVTRRNAVKPEIILERILLRMINESALCLEEGIAANPAFIDQALIHGTGFPPFRGGLLRYADTIGAKVIFSALEGYEKQFGKRFQASALIVRLKDSAGRFYL